MNIADVNRGIQKHKRPQRLGRGPGSGQGKTAGRGHKGQGQLSGWTQKPWFEGGQFPLVRRVPKRGFTNSFARRTEGINLSDLEREFAVGEEVTPAALIAKKLISSRCQVVKILGNGTLSKKLKISAHAFSKSALEKIQKAGAQSVVLPGPAPVVKNVKRKRAKPLA